MTGWIINRPKATITCSKCKARLNANLFMDMLEKWNYCPYCGADMRAEQTEPQRNMAEDIVESFGFVVESYRQAKAKTEPQTVISYMSGSNSYGEQIQTDSTDCSWQKGE